MGGRRTQGGWRRKRPRVERGGGFLGHFVAVVRVSDVVDSPADSPVVVVVVVVVVAAAVGVVVVVDAVVGVIIFDAAVVGGERGIPGGVLIRYTRSVGRWVGRWSANRYSAGYFAALTIFSMQCCSLVAFFVCRYRCSFISVV